jgi:hypothetical protein
VQDNEALSAALEPAFRSQEIQKLGLELMSDLRKLAASYATVAAFSEARCCLDLKNLWACYSDANGTPWTKARKQVGLSFLADKLLGKPLDKAMQVTLPASLIAPFLGDIERCTIYLRLGRQCLQARSSAYILQMR